VLSCVASGEAIWEVATRAALANSFGLFCDHIALSLVITSMLQCDHTMHLSCLADPRSPIPDPRSPIPEVARK
jgi:hypothetical protein